MTDRSVRVVTAPQPKGIPYRDDRYVKHASPESIRAYLAKARDEQRKADRVVAWLASLLVQRENEIEAGTWPPAGGTA